MLIILLNLSLSYKFTESFNYQSIAKVEMEDLLQNPLLKCLDHLYDWNTLPRSYHNFIGMLLVFQDFS